MNRIINLAMFTVIALLSCWQIAYAADYIQTNIDPIWQTTCANTTFLVRNATVYSPGGAIILNQTLFCEHGCGSDIYGNSACKYSPFIRNITVIAMVIIITLLAIWLVRHIR